MYERILFPHDASAAATEALTHLRAMASATGAEVLLLHVVEPTPLDLDVAGTSPDDAELSNPALEELAAELRAQGLGQVRTLVLEGPPGERIVEAARDQACDLIVIGTRGHGGVRRLVLGSVGDYVMRHADVPVLLVHAG
jgi:nucleotide-binding universal stress UspA family protein